MAGSFIKKAHNLSDVAAWIKQAEDDRSWAEASFREGEYRGACFVAHQLAEKSLKALIFAMTPVFTPALLKKLHTHDLFSLVKQAETRGWKPSKIIRQACEELNVYYMASRYPDVHEAVGEYTREIAKRALYLSLKVLQEISNSL